MKPRNLAERLYALILHAMPADFADARDDALETFRDLLADSRRHGRRRHLAALVHCCATALGAALRARLAAIWHTLALPAGTLGRLRRSPANLVRSLVDDSRLARRSLGRRPAFGLAVVTVLALGIGATTSIFSVVDCIVLRPLPYPQAERLVYFDEGSHPGPLFERWQTKTKSFEIFAAAYDQPIDLTGDGPPLSIAAARVNRDFFTLFDGRPTVGRLLTGDDFAPGQRVAVLGAGLWQRRWGGDPQIVGRTISLNGEAWTVAGVMASDFVPPEILTGQRVDVWLPIDASAEVMGRWDTWLLGVAARLRPEVSLDQARAEIDAIAVAVAEEQPNERRELDGTPRATPLVALHDATVGQVRGALLMLFGAVSLMLLMACLNVAGLLLARGRERRREMSLRLALGAHRVRVASQVMVESLLLALLGGLGGIALAFAMTRALGRWMPGDLPRFVEVAVDLRILTLAVATALATGLLFGLAPAWQGARTRLSGALSSRTGGSEDRTNRRLGNSLVVAQVAMALVLLAGAGLLGHSLFRLLRVELGFQPEGLARMQLRLGEGYDEERREQATRELLQRIEALPGVRSAALGWTVPFDFTGNHRCCWRSRFTTTENAEPIRSFVHPVSPGYFHTLGARLSAGRGFGWQDAEANPVPVVVNRPLAQRLFPGREAVGQPLQMIDDELVIVGVVEDVRRWGAAWANENAVYLPYYAYGVDEEEMAVVARTDSDQLTALAPALRHIVWDLDPNLPVGDVASLEQRIALSLAEPRFYSFLFGGFAGLGLLLAAVGLFGTLLYSVHQRQRELGIRLAVGARHGDLLRLVLGRGLLLASIGLALGLGGSLALSRLLTDLVFGITATDPSTYIAVCLVLLAVALAASYLPARRAARTDPIKTLRAQ
ncbi:MAG: ADOP family duplicated permease [Acidobacteriota bacterium]